MKVIFESIFDKMDKAIEEAEKLGKTIMKFVVNPAEFDEFCPGLGLGGYKVPKMYYSLIPVEVEK